MTNTLLFIVEKLLYINRIVYDKKELAFQIQTHPSYPSLHAVTGVLDHFNIENVAAEVPVDSEILKQLPNTFIAQVSTKNSLDLVVVSKDDGEYRLTFEDKKSSKISENKFLSFFTGVVVVVEKNDVKNEIKKRIKLKNIVLFSSLIISIVCLLIQQNKGIHIFALSILSSIGIIISYNILKQELGENSLIGEKVCSTNVNKNNCNTVLNSKGAQVVEDHKLSDLSIIYFSSLLLIGFLAKDNNLLYGLSFFVIPVTVYSIYYQYTIVKTWCVLCLFIVGVLWLQATIAYVKGNVFFGLHLIKLNDVLITVIIFIASYLVWSFVKPLVKKTNDLQKEHIEFVKFKRSFNLFNTLLQKQPTLSTTIESSDEICFGNKKAALEIVIITNPFCGYCKPVHKIVDELLNKYNDTLKIIIRFNTPIDKPELNGFVVSRKLIELFKERGEKECGIAMTEIYEGLSFKKWISKWGKAKDKENSLLVLKNQKEWCINNQINFTPEIIVQGKPFPKEYKKADLLFFIEDLQEYYQSS